MTATQDIKIISVETCTFPRDNFDEEGICLVRVYFVIAGRALAQLLGRQARVMGQALKSLSTSQALGLLDKGARNPTIESLLVAVKKPIAQEINFEAQKYFNCGARIIWDDGFGFADTQEGWEAHVDHTAQAIAYTTEFDVMWQWTP